jgi:RNA polymerase sigma-70 factor (ECF subfamily)
VNCGAVHEVLGDAIQKANVMVALSYDRIFRRAKGLLVDRMMSRSRPLAGLSDDRLVERCKRRDHEAFTEIVERYKTRVHWLVIRTAGEAHAEDLTQEVFLRAYQAIEAFRGDSSFRTWLYRIARNLCITQLRKMGTRGEHLPLDTDGEEAIHHLLPASISNLEDEIDRRDLSQAVRVLIARLPENYRTVLTLFYLEQLRYDEIAEIMSIPMGTVKTYIHRARLRLRDIILAEPETVGLTNVEDAAACEGGDTP